MTQQQVNFWVRQEQQWFIGQLELLRNRAVRLNDTRTAFVINDLLARARLRREGKDLEQQPAKTKKTQKRRDPQTKFWEDLAKNTK